MGDGKGFSGGDEWCDVDSATDTLTLNGTREALWTRRLLYAVLAGMLILALLVFHALMVLSDEPFDPLGNYPLQVVESGMRTDDGDAVHIVAPDLEVVVTGTKCNDSAVPVTVRGSLSWASITPPGSFTLVASGVSSRPPGCETRTFHNPIPPAVLERMDELAAAGFTEVVWQINGTEVPIAPDGTEGAPRSWRTENFVLRHVDTAPG